MTNFTAVKQSGRFWNIAIALLILLICLIPIANSFLVLSESAKASWLTKCWSGTEITFSNFPEINRSICQGWNSKVLNAVLGALLYGLLPLLIICFSKRKQEITKRVISAKAVIVFWFLWFVFIYVPVIFLLLLNNTKLPPYIEAILIAVFIPLRVRPSIKWLSLDIIEIAPIYAGLGFLHSLAREEKKDRLWKSALIVTILAFCISIFWIMYLHWILGFR